MIEYVTIQKLANDTGVHVSSIQKMIKQGELTPYKRDGLKRVFINLNEFVKKMTPKEESIDLDNFLV